MQVKLVGIRKYYGPVRANDGIDLALAGGRIYGLLGENGAGKSTLMKVLSGYHQPDSGEIRLEGTIVKFRTPAAALDHGIGMIYQDPLDVPPMRAVENYLLGRDTGLRLDFRRASRELKASAERLGFEVDPQEYIDTLTLGERQQLELIRLLSYGAEVLILDEPTTGISAEQKDSLFESIRRLAHEEGKTVIFVSHKLSEVQELCDQVIVLRRGKRVGEAEIPCPTEELVRMMFEGIPTRETQPHQSQEEVLLTLRGLELKEDRVQVRGVNLKVRKGEVFGLAGLEGSGQGALLRACAGLSTPTAGEILLRGQPITDVDYHGRRKRGVAYLPAGRLEEGLVAGLTLWEHVALTSPAGRWMIDREHYRRLTAERVEQYQIVGNPETPVEALSGGNQQRALFALLRSPLQLLLLEHPTRGLDVRSAEWIWQLLFQRVAGGSSILFYSADLDELIDRSDRIAAFSGGKMSRIVEANATSSDELGHLIGGEA